LHEAGGSCTGASRTARGATCAGSRGTGAEAAYTCARRVLHDADVDAAKGSSCLSAQDVGAGDGDVVARDGQIEVVFQREIDGILQRELDDSVVYEAVEARRVSEIRLGYVRAAIRVDGIPGMRNVQAQRGLRG